MVFSFPPIFTSGPLFSLQQEDGTTLIATASWDQTAKVFRPDDEEGSNYPIIELTGHSHGLYAVDFSHLRPSLIGTVSEQRKS
jgi:WD40 repeat protein